MLAVFMTLACIICVCMYTGRGPLLWAGPDVERGSMVGGTRCIYGMWYYREVTKLCAYGLMFIVSGTSRSKGKGPTWFHNILPSRFLHLKELYYDVLNIITWCWFLTILNDLIDFQMKKKLLLFSGGYIISVHSLHKQPQTPYRWAPTIWRIKKG